MEEIVAKGDNRDIRFVRGLVVGARGEDCRFPSGRGKAWERGDGGHEGEEGLAEGGRGEEGREGAEEAA